MKNLILTLVISVLVMEVFSQEKKDTSTINLNSNCKILIITDKNNNDTVNVEIGDTIKHKKKKYKGHWAGIEFGLNGYRNVNNSMTLNAGDKFMALNQTKSWFFNLNFAEINIGIYKKHIGFTSGLGLQLCNYRLKSKNNILIGDSSSLIYYQDTINYQKNKLVVNYLTLPLLIEFNIPVNNKKDKFFFNFGVIGALRIGSHTKEVFELNGEKQKQKQRNDYHLSALKYDLTTRIGYNNLSLFVNYGLSTFLNKNEGPELYPWSAGLGFSF
jgi:hypothetical protein